MPRQRTTGQKRAEASRRREKNWRSIIATQRKSGLSHSEFCRREAIPSNNYFWWKRELGIRAKKGRKGAGEKVSPMCDRLIASTN